MSETSLIEVLKQRFGIQNIDVYGECVVVSNRFFLPGWEKELRNQGYSIYTNSFNGEAAFFVKLKKDKNNPSSEKSAPPAATPIVKGGKHSFWSPEEIEKLKQLDAEGLSNTEIGEAMGRSKASIAWKKTQMGLTQARSKPTIAGTLGATAPNPVTAPPITKDLILEFLSACSLLYPKYPHAFKVLLEATLKEVKTS